MEWLLTLTLLGSGLTLLIQQGLAQATNAVAGQEGKPSEPGIWCYNCNSKDDPRCGNPFDYPSFQPINCSDLLYLQPHNRDLLDAEKKLVPTLCRKNIQTVTLGGVTDYRIVRACGFLPKNKPKYGVEVDEEDTVGEDRCYKRAGTFEVTVTYCTCTKDRCNGGLRPTGTPLTWGLLVVSGLIYNLPMLQ